MLILVFSDSHGKTDEMLSLSLARRPDAIFHLGDHAHDIDVLYQHLPGVPIHCVPGNCDISLLPCTLTLTFETQILFLTHGHLHGVKRSTVRLETAARAAGAKTALFGHTHIPCCEDRGGLLLLNPGSISQPRNGMRSYGLLEIDGVSQYAQIIPVP